MTFIAFSCPYCHNSLDAPPALADKEVLCPKCGKPVRVARAAADNSLPVQAPVADRSEEGNQLRPSAPAASHFSALHEDEFAARTPGSSIKADDIDDSSCGGPNERNRNFRILCMSALSGILCLVPGSAVFPLVAFLAEKSSDSFAGSVTIIVLYVLGVAWISSVISALICKPFLARAQDIVYIASVFLANSAGWACLFLAYPDFDFFTSASAGLHLPYAIFLVVQWLRGIFSLPAIFIAGIGLLITWRITKAARR
jgi:hypothetical protein